MIELKNISKKFGKHTIFENVNLKIKEGQLIHLQGINGSGKSTLFKIICDIMEPTSGEVVKRKDLHIGAVIENSGFIENENLEFNLKYLYNLKNKFNEQKVKKLCSNFHLDLYSKEKLKNYSVGMRQKVAIIQAVMEDQALILLDEPTRGIDQEGIISFYELLKLLKEENKTIIIASHDLEKELPFDLFLKLENQKLICEKN